MRNLLRVIYFIVLQIALLLSIALVSGCGRRGRTGERGESCTTVRVTQGVQVNCGGGTTAIIPDAPVFVVPRTPSPYDIVEIIDPCGHQSDYDEVLLVLGSGEILAHYSDAGKQFFTLLKPGRYRTTDGTNCMFTIVQGGSGLEVTEGR